MMGIDGGRESVNSEGRRAWFASVADFEPVTARLVVRGPAKTGRVDARLTPVNRICDELLGSRRPFQYGKAGRPSRREFAAASAGKTPQEHGDA
jgi:hypothetical protein